jgi:hypothetical protein
LATRASVLKFHKENNGLRGLILPLGHKFVKGITFTINILG